MVSGRVGVGTHAVSVPRLTLQTGPVGTSNWSVPTLWMTGMYFGVPMMVPTEAQPFTRGMTSAPNVVIWSHSSSTEWAGNRT